MYGQSQCIFRRGTSQTPFRRRMTTPLAEMIRCQAQGSSQAAVLKVVSQLHSVEEESERTVNHSVEGNSGDLLSF